MKGRVAIVALDINEDDNLFSTYKKATVEEKIDRIAKRIEVLCQELKQLEPDALWIITWREHGISGPSSTFVPAQLKSLLKKKMSGLTVKYPHLAILAGSIVTLRHFSYAQAKYKLLQISGFYQHHQWIERKDTEGELRKHRKAVEHLRRAKWNGVGVNVIRNTVYVFQGNDIKRHDKTAPYEEIPNKLTHTVFQPGKGRNLSPYFELDHPTTHSRVKIGIEICREHRMEVLKTLLKDNKPDIHFVLSNTVEIALNKMHGDFLVQVDGDVKPQLITYKDIPSCDMPIALYKNNLLADRAELMGPLEPLYPFERKLLDAIDDSLNKLTKGGVIYNFLTFMQNEFAAALQRANVADMYNELCECFVFWDDLMKTLPDKIKSEPAPESVGLEELKAVQLLKEQLKKLVFVQGTQDLATLHKDVVPRAPRGLLSSPRDACMMRYQNTLKRFPL